MYKRQRLHLAWIGWRVAVVAAALRRGLDAQRAALLRSVWDVATSGVMTSHVSATREDDPRDDEGGAADGESDHEDGHGPQAAWGEMLLGAEPDERL